MNRVTLTPILLVAILTVPVLGQKTKTGKEVQAPMFLPLPLNDDWTKWIVGEWEGAGESNAGKGRGTVQIELTLNGQFLSLRGEAEITDLTPEYLKKHMHASDEEIARFKASGYKSLELYTIDQKSGEVVGYLFDSLRCLAQGRGKREGNKETVNWQWATGHKSTRITEKISQDKMAVIERTINTDGSVMEDKGVFTRKKNRSAERATSKQTPK